MSRPTSQELLAQYQSGHSAAATAIFDRYVQRLIALVRGRLGAKLKRRLDPQDVVQSAYRSFFLHAKNDEFHLAEAGDLWRLLARITLNKLYGQIEKQTAAKRSPERESASERSLADLQTLEPTAAEAVAVFEQLHLALRESSADECLVLTSSLRGQSTQEIAKSLGKTERTVRRLLAQAREKFERRLLAAEDLPGRTSAAAEPLTILSTPLQYADYAIERLLGTGGMGKVYRAKDKRSGQDVALKALHKSRLTDPRAVAQFVQEAQVLERLQHPNIVGVRGLGQFPAGGYFIVMDFIDGTDLQSQLEGGPLPAPDALAIVEQVAGAVAHAHDHGIVHCDLKPGNVLVDKCRRAIVTDFGFAYMAVEGSRAGRTMIGGTAGYMAPEVQRGSGPPTRSADIFGLGALLWALCVGVPPNYVVSSPQVEQLPAEIRAICMKCLATNPTDRFATAVDVCHALHSANAHV